MAFSRKPYYRKPNLYAMKVKESVLNRVLEIIERNKVRIDEDLTILYYETLKEEINKIW
jgi:hypothetical protein